jgi:hypothetical protein
MNRSRLADDAILWLTPEQERASEFYHCPLAGTRGKGAIPANAVCSSGLKYAKNWQEHLEHSVPYEWQAKE